MGLDACGLVLAAEIGACRSTGMSSDAYGSMLATKIDACGSTGVFACGFSFLWCLWVLILVAFDSCGSCGGDWCLWWINDLTMRGKRRRRCLWREVRKK